MTRVLAAAAALMSLLTPQVFRTSTEGVRVDVLVTAGRTPVAGLTAADFELRDNGVVQQVTAASRGDVPLSVVFALDTSASVAGRQLEHLRAAMTEALSALAPDDRAALLTFSQDIAQLASFTDAGKGFPALLAATPAGGATSVNDAAFAAMMLRDTHPGRQLVLVLSDGRDTASWLPAEAVVQAAHRSDAVVYSVVVSEADPSPSWTPFVDMAARLPLLPGLPATKPEPPLLVRLADETGGTVFDATKEDAGARLAQALREFKSRYLLTYTPQGVDARGWHALEVKVKRRGTKVVARRGYQK